MQEDFHKKCCYTDSSEQWFGGITKMEIEHFRPKSKFPELTTSYSNLAYCCSFANRAKSNDYDEKMYLDPCDVDYNEHFSRDDQGNIVPHTDQAKYMYKKLKLYLERYGIMWMLSALQEKMQILNKRIDEMRDGSEKENLLALHYKLSKDFQTYLNYLALN